MAKGLVIVDTDRCKGCGLCTHVCPANILTLSTETFNAKGYYPVVVTDADKCIGCASCARICPDIVFTVYRANRTFDQKRPDPKSLGKNPSNVPFAGSQARSAVP